MNDEGGNGLVSVTLKGGPGYEAPWVVFRGDSPEEIYNELRKLESDDEFLRAVATIGATFGKIYVEQSGGAQAPAIPAQRAASPAAPPSNGPVCSKCNAPMTWQTWSKKDGSKTFEAWKCPTASFGHDVDWRTPRP